MDVGSQEMRAELVGMGKSSLLQYIAQSGTWAGPSSKDTLAAILARGDEERASTTQFTRLLQKKRIRLPPLGAYPSHFTTVHFVGVEYLVPRLNTEHVKEIAQIERILSRIDDAEIRAMGQAYLDMKRRHLDALQELAKPKAPAAA